MKKDKKQSRSERFKKIIEGHVNDGKQANPEHLINYYKINKRKNLTDFRGLKYKLMSKHHPLDTIKVIMELSNGGVMPFVTRIKNGGFVFDNGYYIIDEKYKYFDANANLWCFDYHEELAFPINKRVKLSQLKKEIYSNDDVELETAINPKSLQKFMESTVIQKLLAGAEMEDSLKKMKMMIIILLVLVGVTLLLVIKMSGILGGV